MKSEDFQLWKQMPQTQEVMNGVEKRIEELKEHLATGGTLIDRMDKAAMETSHTVGLIEGLRELLDVDIEKGKED